MHGEHLIKSWSVTQSVISLSSGEAEHYALVKGATRALGIQAMMREFQVNVDVDVQVTLKTDASAAMGIAMCRGLGKVKHIDVTQLWVQDKVAEKKILIKKVGTQEHVSDALTKGISCQEMDWHMSQTNQVRVG